MLEGEKQMENFPEILITLALQQDVERHLFSHLIVAFYKPMKPKTVFMISQALFHKAL